MYNADISRKESCDHEYDVCPLQWDFFFLLGIFLESAVWSKTLKSKTGLSDNSLKWVCSP